MDVEEIIARRTDLSTFLVHLTKDAGDAKAKVALINILKDRIIEARNPFGSAVNELKNPQLKDILPGDRLEECFNSQKVVCFTETPLEHIHLLIKEVDGRKIKFEPYGIAVTKVQGRRLGANPVWYLDMTPGHDWLVNSLNKIISKATEDALNGICDFSDHPVAKLTPFIEHMGTWSIGGRKEFWWEREWRHLGNLKLPENFIVLCPQGDMTEIKASCKQWNLDVPLIDPSWGLEQIIGHLAGFQTRDVGPMPSPQNGRNN